MATMATMAQKLFSPNPITQFSNHTLLFPSNNKVSQQIAPKASSNSSSSSIPIPIPTQIPYQQQEQPLSVELLEEQFGKRGVSFEKLGPGCVVTMALMNGSAALVMLPEGLITSYKAAMWHRGTDEFIHSLVTADNEDPSPVRGGVSLAFGFRSGDGVAWSPSNWALLQRRGSSRSSIQLELLCTNSRDMIEVRHIITLRKDELSSDVVITNLGSSPAQLTGCILSHLRVSSPEATFAIGLEGSDFSVKPPFRSAFSLIPPDFGTGKESRVAQLMNSLAFWNPKRIGDKKNAQRQEEEEILEGEEDESQKKLSEEISLIYTNAPQGVTVIDRGRRNSVVVGRKGFEELYMFSPGSYNEMYGDYAYVCLGQTAMLKPIIVEPGQVLQLGQDLYNPNL